MRLTCAVLNQLMAAKRLTSCVCNCDAPLQVPGAVQCGRRLIWQTAHMISASCLQCAAPCCFALSVHCAHLSYRGCSCWEPYHTDEPGSPC
jgi:hypothetical protein